jgi:hypothetical protein
MKKMRSSLLSVFLFCQFMSFAVAQKPAKPSIAAVGYTPGDDLVRVTFDGVAAAKVPDINDVSKWAIVIFYDDNSTSTVTGANLTIDTSTFGSDVGVTVPKNVLTDKTTSLVVSFNGSQSKPSKPSSKLSQSYFMPAASQNLADNYLTGSYSPAIHSATQYSISGLVTLTPQIRESSFYVGGTASVETDNRPSADPDSFFVSPLLQWIYSNRFASCRAQGALLNWDVAGLQFDRSTTTKTFVSSAIAETPILIYPAPARTKGVKGCKVNRNTPKIRPTNFNASMTPYWGISSGTNLSNALQSGGSGFALNGVVGGSIDIVSKVPHTAWLQKVELTGIDTLRIPATNEIFTYTHYISQTGKTVSLPTLSTHLRNHVKGEVDLTIAKPFSISIQYEDGELPPAYKTIDNKVTVGIKIALQQAKGAPSKISTNSESQ